MRILLLTAGSIIFCQSLIGQILTFEEIDFNNAKVGVQNNGAFFHNSITGQAAYEIPKGDGINAVFSSSFWFTGDYPDSSIRVTGGTGASNFTDFYPGPHGDSYSTQTYQNRYNSSIWSLTQEEIDFYSVWWNACDGNSPTASSSACENIPTNQLPTIESLTKINNWPAHGSQNNNELYFLAPFWDNYENPNNIGGKYEPNQGDVPWIKGCSAKYLIQSNYQVDSSLESQNMDLEVHYLMYQFDSENDLNNTTFIEVEIYNWGQDTIKNFIIGNYFDADLGGPNDDFYGCDSIRNLIYFYNGDNDDQTDGATNVYGVNPPAIGIMCLSDPMNSAKLFSGSIHGDDNSIQSKYNQLHGLWGDSSAILDNNNLPTNFMYSGNPNNLGSDSEYQLAQLPGERRAVMGINVGDLPPSSILDNGYFPDTVSSEGGSIPIKLTFAVIYSRTGNHLENVISLFETADFVQNFYDAGELSCQNGNVGIDQLQIDEISLFPNPTTNNLILQLASDEIFTGKILSITGQEVQSFSTSGTLTSIDCSKLQNGMYILQLTDGTKMISKQFVKVD